MLAEWHLASTPWLWKLLAFMTVKPSEFQRSSLNSKVITRKPAPLYIPYALLACLFIQNSVVVLVLVRVHHHGKHIVSKSLKLAITAKSCSHAMSAFAFGQMHCIGTLLLRKCKLESLDTVWAKSMATCVMQPVIPRAVAGASSGYRRSWCCISSYLPVPLRCSVAVLSAVPRLGLLRAVLYPCGFSLLMRVLF